MCEIYVVCTCNFFSPSSGQKIPIGIRMVDLAREIRCPFIFTTKFQGAHVLEERESSLRGQTLRSWAGRVHFCSNFVQSKSKGQFFVFCFFWSILSLIKIFTLYINAP